MVPDSLLPVQDAQDDAEAEGLVSPVDDDDTTDFHDIANDDILMAENAAALADEDDAGDQEDSAMVALMDTLQCLGVAPDDACHFAAACVKNKPRFKHVRKTHEERQRMLNAVTVVKLNFMELYG